MFCPKCSAENGSKQKYCRQCGLSLTGVRFALEGMAEETITKYRKGGDLLVTGIIVLWICILNVLINFAMSSEPRSLSTLIILVLGLVISLPIIITGLVRVSKGERLLKAKEQPESVSGIAQSSDPQLPEAPITDQLIADISSRNSITDETTMNLPPPLKHR